MTGLSDEWRRFIFGLLSTSVGAAVAYVATTWDDGHAPHFDMALLIWLVVALVCITVILAYSAYLKRKQHIADKETRWSELTDSIKAIGHKMDVIADMTISHGRAELIHKATKYIADRDTDGKGGWCTAEEKASWMTDYEKYRKLTATQGINNGYIKDLRTRVMTLRIKEL